MNVPLALPVAAGTLGALDMINSAVDVLLERRSRESFGGLPSGEYLIHILSSFGMGVAVAAYAFARPSLPLPQPTGLLAFQVQWMLAVGILLFLTESVLFAKTIAVAMRDGGEKASSARCC